MREHDIQNAIRLHISQQKLGVLFRANVGEAWIGSQVVHNPDGSITIYNPRRLKTGLPNGFSDLFGVTNKGQAVFIEVKSPTGRLRPEQENFLQRMQELGAWAGVARSPEEAERIIRGEMIPVMKLDFCKNCKFFEFCKKAIGVTKEQLIFKPGKR